MTVTRGPRVFHAVPSQPAAEEWVYQLARVFQLSAAEIGLVVNIRRCHVKTVDTEVGNDLLVLDRLDAPSPRAAVPLNRSEIARHPRTGERILMCRYPLAGGFVPVGACSADGAPHPHAGTGFAMSHIIGFPEDAAGYIGVGGEGAIQDPFCAVELQQYRYDGARFTVEHSEQRSFNELLGGWRFTSMPLGNCLADGDDLIGGLVGKPAGRDGASGSGLARWRRIAGQWRLVSFVPVTEADGSYEPSLVRDEDGSLLFAVRGRNSGPNEHAVQVWQSFDNGTTWTKTIHAPAVRAGTPVTINRGPDGIVYMAANPYRETDTLGRRQPSMEMRETLLLWPLSRDRRQLLEPLLVRDCNADFGRPPHGSIWRADHPVGLTVRLADGRWHHVLTYRVLEQNECVGGAPATRHTGTYVEELLLTDPARPGEEFPMDQIVRIGDRRELFVDRTLIERMENVSLKLHEPVSGGVAIRIDKPWEGPANFGMSVIHHGGRYLMYYRGFSLKDKKEQNGVGCVAESRDGVTWSKPALNLVSKPEWPNNNIMANDAKVPEFAFPCAPWVDTRPGVPASERVKLVLSQPLSGEPHTAMNDPAGPKRLVFWGSADGFTFHKLTPQPELVSNLCNCFDGGNTMFWSDVERQYVLYYRWYDGEWGKGHRTMARTTSKDLLRWDESVPMTYGDTPREQFYVNNTQPYFRAPHLYVALAARFMEGRRVLSDAQAEAIGLQSSHGHVYHKDCSDGVLLTSRAGTTRYDRTFMEAFVRPGPGAGNWVSRANYPLTGIFPSGPDQMMFWVSRHYMQDTWHVERLLLRLDGFVSVTAPWGGGELITRPFTFAGNALEINYRTSAAGRVRVELQDVAGTPLPNYALADCREVIGDEVARVVAWEQGADVSGLSGRPVRLRFSLRDADLFSFRFRGKVDGRL